MTAPPRFELTGLGRMFADGTKALDRVSFAVPDGAVVSLVGPSGCGKSTLLRLLAGLDIPTAGMLDWPAGPPAPGETGFVFQDATLLPWATVWDNVYLPFRIWGRSRDEAAGQVDDALELVGLTEFADRLPHQLSGGMRMRASVARALAPGAALLLMDEPFAALDEITRFRLNDDLLRIKAARGCTVLFVTHSVFEAVYLSERVVVMSARPGYVRAEVEIDLPWPRTPELRATPRFAALCGEVSRHLAEGTP